MTSPARVTDDLGVANLALSFCKEDTISSFAEPDRTAARACAEWYGTELDNVLGEDEWDFATAYATPALDPTPSLGPLKNRFPLPADCITVRSVRDAAGVPTQWDVESGAASIGGVDVEAKVLVSCAASVTICYTRRVTNIAIWDSKAVTAFAASLAKRVAPLIGRSNQLSKWLKEQATDEKDEASEKNAREQSRGTISLDTSWTRARRVGLGRSFPFR